MSGSSRTSRCPGGKARGGSIGGSLDTRSAGSTFAGSVSVIAQELSHLEGHLQGLLMIQARVYEGLVATRETGLVNLRAAAENLGDVITGEFDVDAARDGAQGAVYFEEAADFVHDVFKAPRLVARRGREGVAVHRVSDPGGSDPSGRDLLNQSRQDVADFARSHAADER